MLEVAALHYVLLAMGLGFQLCVVMGCLALTARFAEFMDLRVQKQQLLNKDLRRAAVKMIGDVDHRNSAEDRDTIRKFEKVLRQQYVIETCDAGSPSRHVWNFNDWFVQRCAALARFVEVCFRLGMFSMLRRAHVQRARSHTISHDLARSLTTHARAYPLVAAKANAIALVGCHARASARAQRMCPPLL